MKEQTSQANKKKQSTKSERKSDGEMNIQESRPQDLKTGKTVAAWLKPPE